MYDMNRYEALETLRLPNDDALWLAAMAERHSIPKSKLMRMGLSMLRQTWTGERRFMEAADGK